MKKENNNFNFELNNILNKLFVQREEQLYEFTEEEREKLAKKSKQYDNIYVAIGNIPNAFTETINGIKTSIENYLETLNDLQGLENQKFYQEGFSDAINLILNCISNNKGNIINTK